MLQHGRIRSLRGLRQGHKSGSRYYGEFIRDYLAMARTTPVTLAGAAAAPLVAGAARLPRLGEPTAKGPAYRVNVLTRPLRLRTAPRISAPADANVLATLADGVVVQSISGTPVNNFMEVETTLGGELFRGFASMDFLDRITDSQATAARTAMAATPAVNSIPEAHLQPTSAGITKRTGIATARSLNEANMPGRAASDPAGLREDLARIIDYLGTDKPAHKRYQPREGLTFCNIYAHDYCGLAGSYLPRVWWNGPALVKLAAGQPVAPLLGATVDEQRANDLFRWLRDFGEAFGWRADHDARWAAGACQSGWRRDHRRPPS